MALKDLEAKLSVAKTDLEMQKSLFTKQKQELVKIEDGLVEKRETIRRIEDEIERFKVDNIDLSVDDNRLSNIESFRERLPLVEAKFEGTTIFDIHDPLIEWCKANRETLSEHTNKHIAVSMREGIVISTPDKADFMIKIARMTDAQREGLYFAHTSELKV